MVVTWPNALGSMLADADTRAGMMMCTWGARSEPAFSLTRIIVTIDTVCTCVQNEEYCIKSNESDLNICLDFLEHGGIVIFARQKCEVLNTHESWI